MSLKTLEREILFELNRLTIFRRKLKWFDVLAWNTSEETIKKNLAPHETAVFASLCWVAVDKDLLKKVDFINEKTYCARNYRATVPGTTIPVPLHKCTGGPTCKGDCKPSKRKAAK